MPRAAHLVVLVSTLPVLAGCGSSAPEVDGTVTLDGRPLPRVLVQFMPDPRRGTRGPTTEAVTDGEGHYRLHTAGDRDRSGTAVGWYRVVVLDADPPATRQGDTPPPPRIPVRYANAESTPLRIEVKPGKQSIALPLSGK